MITIKEIAKLAGVSIGTVDRVLHNRGRVAKETEKKVREIIEKYDYKPNIFASQLKKGIKYKFAVLMPEYTQDGGYWNIPFKGIKKAQRELVRVNTSIDIYFYDKYSVTSFDKTFNKIITLGYNGLLIAPVLFETVSKLIDKIPKDTPYVFFDSYLPDSNQLSFIGQDPYMGGFVAGKLMHYLLDDLSKIITFKLIPEDYHINERVKGFVDYFKQDKKNVQVHNIKGYSTTEDIFKSIDKIIKNNLDIEGIFFPTALTYMAAKSIEKVNKKIYLIGYDLLEENKYYLKKGLIDFIIDQDPYKQGYEGIYSLYRYICLKESIKSKIFLPINIVIKENLEYFYSL
ncbi:MAG: substrate-binding domain-containing protein [Deferribacterota bacterium]|nr:substrate-binding domain-containing protein [Deferribacterota bacterium]